MVAWPVVSPACATVCSPAARARAKSATNGRGRIADLVPAQSQGHDAVIGRERRDPVDRLRHRIGTRLAVAHAVRDPAHLHAPALSRFGPAPVHPGQHLVEVEPAFADVRLRIEVDLEVADVLRRRVLAELEHDGREVLRCAQAGADGDVDLDEVREIAEAEKLAQPRLVTGRRLHAVATGELEERRRAHGAFQVDVDLRLWHAANERLQSGIDRVRAVGHRACAPDEGFEIVRRHASILAGKIPPAAPCWLAGWKGTVR